MIFLVYLTRTISIDNFNFEIFDYTSCQLVGSICENEKTVEAVLSCAVTLNAVPYNYKGFIEFQ